MTKANILIRLLVHNQNYIVLRESWGEKGIFYNPGGVLKRGVYVLTVKEKDGKNDKGSYLNQEHVYRVNTGIKKESFIKIFGSIPKRPPAGGTVLMDYDFTALDMIIPHPVYAWMGWICVLNPSEKTFLSFEPLIKESYDFAKEKFAKKNRHWNA